MQKYCVLFLLSAAVSPAETKFTTGQAARGVIGQRNFTSQTPGAAINLLGGVSGLAYANGMLFVVDDNRVFADPHNSRVLIFKNLPETLTNPSAEIGTDFGDNPVRCPLCTGSADVVLGQDDFSTTSVGLSQKKFNQPTAVASNGRIVVVADTNNNRVLIWNSIPTIVGQPADLVLGQANFTTSLANEGRGNTPSARSFRGPQGVWIQGTRLYVADTVNNRVLIWRSIPTQNYQPADIVLGQKDFTSVVLSDITQTIVDAKANNMLSPVAVTSDGQRLIVTDLGHNRVLIWNSIPDSNQAPADVVLGQKDMTTAIANDTPDLCQSNGTDADGKATYPLRCDKTMDFPRFALSTGTQLFIADGGNDRIMVYNSIPTQNAQAADAVLGQPVIELNQVSDSANPEGRSAADAIGTPMSLAWDGTNLYASDPFYRRVVLFTPGEDVLPYNAVRNAASLAVYALGAFTFSGTIKENDVITLTISSKDYKYTVKADDNFTTIVNAFVELINAGDGDPNVIATPNPALDQLVLTAKVQGDAGNSITLAQTLSDNAVILVTASSSTLLGGQNAAKIAPGTLVTLRRKDDSPPFTDRTESAPDVDPLPRELAGVQVYFDGLRAPLVFVSPDKVTAQIPYDVNDATSVSAYVRSRGVDGRVMVTGAIAVPIIDANPGIFAEEGADPRRGIVTHYSSYANGTISVDGAANAGDIATLLIENREYSYTVVTDDTLDTIETALIDLVNSNPAEKVIAFPAGVFNRIRIRAKVIGPEGNGIAIGGKVSDGSQVILSATNTALCCANIAGAPVTEDNPALPGETIVVIATGLGIVNPDDAKNALATGFKYNGPDLNRPNEFVSSLAGGRTANVLFSGLKRGAVGLYEVQLELNTDIPTNPLTQLTIAQFIYVSNIITFAVVNPNGTTTGQ